MVKLKASNFILRSWKKGDEKQLLEQINNEKILEHMKKVFPDPVTLESVKKYINDRLVGEKQLTSLAVIFKNKLIGAIGFRIQKNSKKTAHLGYWLGEKYWGKGIMTEALKIITKYAFENFDLAKLQAKVYSNNIASIKILEKAGYVLEEKSKREKVLGKIIYSKQINPLIH